VLMNKSYAFYIKVNDRHCLFLMTGGSWSSGRECAILRGAQYCSKSVQQGVCQCLHMWFKEVEKAIGIIFTTTTFCSLG